MRSQGVPEGGGQQGLQRRRSEFRSEGAGKQAICAVNKVNNLVQDSQNMSGGRKEAQGHIHSGLEPGSLLF